MATPTTYRAIEANWFEREGDDLANSLGGVFRIVRDESMWRFDKDDYHWGLYNGSGQGNLRTQSRRHTTYEGGTLPDNVCKMCPDTLTAKVSTIRPIPQVLTSRGNWKDQRRARKLRQFIQGAFYQHKVHEQLAPDVIRDALVGRGGCVQVFAEGKKTRVERIQPWTMFCDDWDAEFGEPLTMMRLRTMDRRKAMLSFGRTEELREKIKSAGWFSSIAWRFRQEERASTVDRVELLEAWYRCIDHDDEDDAHQCPGRHVIICDGAILFDEEWHHSFFPFAWLFYDTPHKGFFGNGLVETLEGYQVCIDEANEKHEQSLRDSGTLVLLRDGSGVFETDMVNSCRVAHIRPGPYEPTIFQMDLVNEHIRMRSPELIERALNASGVSQMAAQSQKPAGIDSGIALQTLDDVESQRHIVFGRRFEAWCMDVARLLVESVKKIAKDYGDFAVKVPMRGAYLDLKWSDVEIDGFQLEMQSVGQLYTSFAGRLDKLKTIFEMGAIDRGTFLRHMDAGDIQSELDLETADKLAVDEQLECMLDSEQDVAATSNSDYKAPNDTIDLDWAFKRAHQKLVQIDMDGAPQYVRDLIRRWIDDVDYLRDKKKATAMTPDGGPMQPGPPMPPMPVGGPPAPPGPMMPPPPMGLGPQGDTVMMPPPPMAA